MKKAVLTLVFITILVVSFAAWVVHSHLYVENQTNKVKITAIEKLGGWYPIGGLLMGSEFNVTIQNSGVNSVSNLTLTSKSVYNSTGEAIYMQDSVQIDTLQVGESREIKVWAYWNLGDSSDAVTFITTLKLGDAVLDERKEPF
jgi:hypothetical protein